MWVKFNIGFKEKELDMLLINFSFGNYASFKNEQAFTMERTIVPANAADWNYQRVSPVAAVYGANASGKSRFLRAIWFVASFVATSYSQGDSDAPINVPPFLLDKQSLTEPTSFLVDFIGDDGFRYKYWFAVTRAEVVEENLYIYRSSRPSLLFARSIDDAGHQDIEFGPSFRGAKRTIWDITRRNSLFVSVAATAGNKAVIPVYNALVRGIGFYDAPEYGSEIATIKQEAESGNNQYTSLQDLIQYADFGVTGIRVQNRDLDESVSPLMEAIAGRFDSEFGSEVKASFMQDLKTELAFQHKGNGFAEWFPMSSESDGTVAALSFLSVALRALTSGNIALVDEIDKSLHPWLVREFVGLFVDPETNPLQAQLIFTTHDESLIDESGDDRLLDRDQIWLTEKNASGESELIAVTEFSPRSRDNIGRNYNHGVYGAVPMLTLHSHVARAVNGLIAGSGQKKKDALSKAGKA